MHHSQFHTAQTPPPQLISSDPFPRLRETFIFSARVAPKLLAVGTMLLPPSGHNGLAVDLPLSSYYHIYLHVEWFLMAWQAIVLQVGVRNIMSTITLSGLSFLLFLPRIADAMQFALCAAARLLTFKEFI